MSFFESTPIGRILNRFNKDMEFTEYKIPDTFKTSLRCGLTFFSAIVVIAINSPFFLIVLVPISVLYYFIQVRGY